MYFRSFINVVQTDAANTVLTMLMFWSFSCQLSQDNPCTTRD